jgi:hypothetical protein
VINRDAVIRVSGTIAQLRDDLYRIKQELQNQEIKLDRLLTCVDVPEEDSTVPEQPINVPLASLASRIIGVLKGCPDREFTASQLRAEIPGSIKNGNALHVELARLAVYGKISKVSRGLYASCREDRKSKAADQ